MRILHLADLHIGKRVNGFNMIEDQRFALKELVSLIDKEDVDSILIAGDVYDQSVPSSEAMSLFDEFITQITDLDKNVLIIAGNHDSAERLSFASRLMVKSKVYISQAFAGQVEKVTLEDEYGPLNFYLLPFIKPINIKTYYPQIKIDDFQAALDFVIGTIDLDKSQRNIILSHQFIVGSQRSDSEEIYLGGSEGISLDTYDEFDYVALGHIHKKQSFREGRVSYPGSLLKYSKSESSYKKSIRIIDFKEKANLTIEEKSINYLRDMREISGLFEEVMDNAKKDKHREDYVHINLFDEDEVFDGQARLRELYPNMMSMRYVNQDDFLDLEKGDFKLEQAKDPFEIFNDFYEYRKNRKLDPDKADLVKEIISEVWGEI